MVSRWEQTTVGVLSSACTNPGTIHGLSTLNYSLTMSPAPECNN